MGNQAWSRAEKSAMRGILKDENRTGLSLRSLACLAVRFSQKTRVPREGTAPGTRGGENRATFIYCIPTDFRNDPSHVLGGGLSNTGIDVFLTWPYGTTDARSFHVISSADL